MAQLNIWLITIGEPVPLTPECENRLWRTGYFAHFLAEHGHTVLWWTSAFDHFHKKHHFPKDTNLRLNQRLEVQFLHGGGYPSNLSLQRLRDHRRLAAKFSGMTTQLPPPDIVVCALPTIELSLAAVKYGLTHRVPVVLDIRDMWPDIFLDLVPLPFRKAAAFFLWPMFRDAQTACAGASAITGVTAAFVDWGLKKAGRLKTTWDRPFPLGYAREKPAREKILAAERFWDGFTITPDGNGFVGCFFGTLGHQLDIETVIHAGQQLRESSPPFTFVICGTGDRREVLRRLAAPNNRIIFPGWVDAAQIHVLMQRSMVGLDPMPDRYDFAFHINNKAIEYLSAGLPVISSPHYGVLSDLLKQHQCGMSYPTGDANALATLLIQLSQDPRALSRMSENATRLYHEMFVAEKVYGEMMDYLFEIAAIHKMTEIRKAG